MGLSRYKFSNLIELVNKKNIDNKYGENDAIGVNIDKIIIPMRGNITEKDFSKFHLVPPGHFAYNPRGSRKLGLGFNDTNNTYIITFNNNVFRIKQAAKKIILDTYLFIYLSRKEWDRFAESISWGSSTEVFDWNVFCDIEIDLPPLSIQQKYVDIYNAMLENQKCYEKGLDDLKLVCDAYIEDLRRKMPCEEIGPYIEESFIKNSNNKYDTNFIKGISINKEFIETKADTNNLSTKNYKIVKNEQFSFNPNTARMGEKFCIAYNNTKDDLLVSAIYPVFEIKKKSKLYPEYLMMFFKRSEFDRYVRFNSWGSARETFNYNDVLQVKTPIPAPSIQKSIIDIFNLYLERKTINEKLKSQIKNICPILIKGSIEEAKRMEA